MRIDDLNELPEWDDDRFRNEDDEGEEWKPNATRTLCKAMYEQWNQVMIVLTAAFESLQESGEDDLFSKDRLEDHKQMILGDAYEVGAKIRSSEVGPVYHPDGERSNHKKECAVHKNIYQQFHH